MVKWDRERSFFLEVGPQTKWGVGASRGEIGSGPRKKGWFELFGLALKPPNTGVLSQKDTHLGAPVQRGSAATGLVLWFGSECNVRWVA